MNSNTPWKQAIKGECLEGLVVSKLGLEGKPNGREEDAQEEK